MLDDSREKVERIANMVEAIKIGMKINGTIDLYLPDIEEPIDPSAISITIWKYIELILRRNYLWVDGMDVDVDDVELGRFSFTGTFTVYYNNNPIVDGSFSGRFRQNDEGDEEEDLITPHKTAILEEMEVSIPPHGAEKLLQLSISTLSEEEKKDLLFWII